MNCPASARDVGKIMYIGLHKRFSFLSDTLSALDCSESKAREMGRYEIIFVGVSFFESFKITELRNAMGFVERI